MDFKTLFFSIALVFLVEDYHAADTTVTIGASSTPTNKPVVIKSTSVKTQTPAAVVTQKGTTKLTTPVMTSLRSTTTQAPLTCKVGTCQGTGLCYNKTSGNINKQVCKLSEICQMSRSAINGTITNYTFSCAANCAPQTGSVGCCSTSDCVPDLNNGVSFITGQKVVAFVCLFMTLMVFI